MFFQLVKKEYLTLQQKLHKYYTILSTLPKETLICARNGKHFKWYISDSHNITYLPKKQRKLAEQLAYKKYITCLIDDLTKEQKALEAYITCYSKHPPKATEQLIKSPSFQELLNSAFVPPSQDLSDWMNSPYEHNPLFPEQLLHKTISGIYVRSKSESIISMCLYTNRVPFRYECELKLGDTTIFPDFTIRHPKTGEVFYWEHFGIMDDSSYSQKAYNKLQLYTTHGIIPSIHLITTYETKNTPINIDIIEKIIAYYFL